MISSVPPRITHQPLDLPLVVAFARSPETILEQVVRLQLAETFVRWRCPSPRICATASFVLSYWRCRISINEARSDVLSWISRSLASIAILSLLKLRGEIRTSVSQRESSRRLGLPGVDDRHAKISEIAGVAGDYCEVVFECRGSNQTIGAIERSP